MSHRPEMFLKEADGSQTVHPLIGLLHKETYDLVQ